MERWREEGRGRGEGGVYMSSRGKGKFSCS